MLAHGTSSLYDYLFCQQDLVSFTALSGQRGKIKIKSPIKNQMCLSCQGLNFTSEIMLLNRAFIDRTDLHNLRGIRD